jgi:hypothetical protein
LRLIERGHATARQVAASADYGVFSGNTDALVSLIESARRETDVTGILVSSSSGDLVVSGGVLSREAFVPGARVPGVTLVELESSTLFIEPIVRSSALSDQDVFDGLGEGVRGSAGARLGTGRGVAQPCRSAEEGFHHQQRASSFPLRCLLRVHSPCASA